MGEAAVEEEDSVEEEVATEAMEVATTTARDMVVVMEAMTTARDMVVVMEAMTTAKDMAVATTTARDMETKVDMEVEVVGQVTAAKASSWTRRKSKTCVLNSRQLELLCCLGHMKNERQSYLFHQPRKKMFLGQILY